MNKSRILTIVVALVLLFVVIFAAFGYMSFSFSLPKGEVSKKVKNLYELANPGTTVEIISMTEESGLYKAVAKVTGSSGTTYTEVYVTKDGNLLTQNVILVGQSIQQIKKLKDFVDCLNGKNLRIFGVLNQTENPQGATATLWQLNILGIYSTQLYISCDGSLVTNCLNYNINQVPSIVVNNTLYSGVKTLEWFEQVTGCKF